MSKFINEETFNKLSKEEQQALLEAERNYQSRVEVSVELEKTVKELSEKNRKKNKNNNE